MFIPPYHAGQSRPDQPFRPVPALESPHTAARPELRPLDRILVDSKTLRLQTPSLLFLAEPAPFVPDFRQPATVRLAAKYLSDNPETLVRAGSGVLARERGLPPEGISRISTYHSFVTPDSKRVYVSVSAPAGGSFYLRGLGAAVQDPLGASLQANARYPDQARTLELQILKADGSQRSLSLHYADTSQRYEPPVQLAADERAFVPVEKAEATDVTRSADLERAQRAAKQTLVGHLDLEPVGASRLEAGTYAHSLAAGPLQALDFVHAGHGTLLQAAVSDGARSEVYGVGEPQAASGLRANIRPHHNVFVELDPSGTIPYAQAELGLDRLTGRPFASLVGVRDGGTRVDDDDDGRFNEAGTAVFPDAGGLRTPGTSNYEATAGYISRTTPGRRISGNEGDKDGYGLPYLLPAQLFAPADGAAGETLAKGRLFFCGNTSQPDARSKYAITVVDADNRTFDVLIGASDSSAHATRNNFWGIDLEQHPLKLPLRVITHEGSDLGLQVFYDPPGGPDLKARARREDPHNAHSPLNLPKMSG